MFDTPLPFPSLPLQLDLTLRDSLLPSTRTLHPFVPSLPLFNSLHPPHAHTHASHSYVRPLPLRFATSFPIRVGYPLVPSYPLHSFDLHSPLGTFTSFTTSFPYTPSLPLHAFHLPLVMRYDSPSLSSFDLFLSYLPISFLS